MNFGKYVKEGLKMYYNKISPLRSFHPAILLFSSSYYFLSFANIQNGESEPMID